MIFGCDFCYVDIVCFFCGCFKVVYGGAFIDFVVGDDVDVYRAIL